MRCDPPWPVPSGVTPPVEPSLVPIVSPVRDPAWWVDLLDPTQIALVGLGCTMTGVVLLLLWLWRYPD